MTPFGIALLAFAGFVVVIGVLMGAWFIYDAIVTVVRERGL